MRVRAQRAALALLTPGNSLIKIKGFRAVTARATFLCLCKETWRKESTPRLRARRVAPGSRSRRDFPRGHPALAENAAHPCAAPCGSDPPAPPLRRGPEGQVQGQEQGQQPQIRRRGFSRSHKATRQCEPRPAKCAIAGRQDRHVQPVFSFETPFTCTLPPFIFSRPGLPMKASPRLFAAFAAIFAFLLPLAALAQERGLEIDIVGGNASALPIAVVPMPYEGDRKSTRLNSSH